jgi:carbonic anhydrase/acetyltransferase-like protein (isoleucine patch superfamily)
MSQTREAQPTRYNRPPVLRAYRGLLPTVHETAYVDPSAQVIGDVAVGSESSLWMNVVVRGDVHRIRIGRRTNLQDGTIVHVMRGTHPTSIGDDVTIGHGVIVHGCTIGDRCLIGMGVILLNGVSVAEDCIVAAGSLLPEGMAVPPRSLVMGSPGRVRRPLTDAEVASILDYATRYVGYRLDYQTSER